MKRVKIDEEQNDAMATDEPQVKDVKTGVTENDEEASVVEEKPAEITQQPAPVTPTRGRGGARGRGGRGGVARRGNRR